MKPYVNIVGRGSAVSIIRTTNPNSAIIQACANSEIKSLTLTGANGSNGCTQVKVHSEEYASIVYVIDSIVGAINQFDKFFHVTNNDVYRAISRIVCIGLSTVGMTAPYPTR